MCVFGQSKSQKKATAQQAQLQEQANAQQAAANVEQARIGEQANALQAQNLAFAKEQSAAAAERQAAADVIAARPDAVSVAGSTNNTVGQLITNGMTGDNPEDEDSTDSRKKGRRSLRIDLSAPQVAGSTGLNVPKG